MFKKKRKLRYNISPSKSPRIARRSPTLRSSKRFARKSSPSLQRIKKYFKLLTITTLIVIFGYGLFFSKYFTITDIYVNEGDILNTNTIVAEEIKEPINHVLGQNLLFTKTEDLELELLSKYPEIETLTVTKNYPNSLEINFAEYPLVANVVNESPNVKKSFVINSKGYAIKENVENPSLPYITIKSEEPINPSTPAIETSKLKYILDTKAYFEDKFGMKIIGMEYKKIARELHLITEKNFTIWLDIQISAEDQLKKLKKGLVKLDIYNEPLQYIDLRIAGGNGDKIIYKRR